MRLPSGDYVDLGVWECGPQDFHDVAGVVFGEIGAGIDGDDFNIDIGDPDRESTDDLGGAVGGGSEAIVEKADVLAGRGLYAVDVGIANGAGDLQHDRLGGGDAHVFAISLEGGGGIERQGRGDALRDGGGLYDPDRLRRGLGGLASSHDDVGIVGQDDDFIAGALVDGFDNLGGAGVHGLTAFHHGGPEAAEDFGEAGAGGDGYEIGAGCEGIYGRGVDFLKMVGLLELHVFDGDVAEFAEADGVVEDVAGGLGVAMDADHVAVPDDDGGVGGPIDEAPELGYVQAGAFDNELGAIALLVGGVLLGVGGEDLLGALDVGFDGDFLAAGEFEEAVQDYVKSLAAGIDDAGLLEDGQAVGSVLDGAFGGDDGGGNDAVNGPDASPGGVDGGGAGRGGRR